MNHNSHFFLCSFEFSEKRRIFQESPPSFSLEKIPYLSTKIELITSETAKKISGNLNRDFNGGKYRNQENTHIIQQTLVDLGYDIGASGNEKNGVDGDYGNKTKNAVQQLQKDLGNSSIDGIFGNTTANALLQALGTKRRENLQKDVKKTQEKGEEQQLLPFSSTKIKTFLGEDVWKEITNFDFKKVIQQDGYATPSTLELSRIYIKKNNRIFCSVKNPMINVQKGNEKSALFRPLDAPEELYIQNKNGNFIRVQEIISTNSHNTNDKNQYAEREGTRTFRESGEQYSFQDNFNG